MYISIYFFSIICIYFVRNNFLINLKSMNDYLIQRKKFADIDLADPFFDSLKTDYSEFEEWFLKKGKKDKSAFVIEQDSSVEAFLYLKKEEEELVDLKPKLPSKQRLKIGTFKINPHGTRLGERFIKKIFDYAIALKIPEVYVTIFPKHKGLIDIFLKYGFEEVAEKTTHNGTEKVYLKSLDKKFGDIYKDYPLINLNTSKFLLSIYPKFHTRLFPDSKLDNENFTVLKDQSHTNSIHKIYICFMDVSALKPGNLIVIYRTTDGKGPAWHRSVITSICTVEELLSKNDFTTKNDFINYCKKYSVFTPEELGSYYEKNRVFVIKMTYNVAFEKRVVRKDLITDVGIPQEIYWGFFQIEEDHFETILKLGGIDESFVIN